MSASLVGSEMCIRDRFYEKYEDLCRLANNGRGMNPTEHLATLLSCLPVSYTHLTLPTICSV
eukprot:14208756-Alexandrium_andersonii.AAC.1